MTKRVKVQNQIPRFFSLPICPSFLPLLFPIHSRASFIFPLHLKQRGSTRITASQTANVWPMYWLLQISYEIWLKCLFPLYSLTLIYSNVMILLCGGSIAISEICCLDFPSEKYIHLLVNKFCSWLHFQE